MSAVTPAVVGYPAMLAALLEGLTATIHLYVNDPALTAERVAADFARPVNEGYRPLPISRWTPTALRGGVAFAVSDPVIFQWPGVGAAVPVRGYLCTAGPLGPLLWAWRRPGAAFMFGPDNPTLLVSVQIQHPPPAGG